MPFCWLICYQVLDYTNLPLLFKYVCLYFHVMCMIDVQLNGQRDARYSRELDIIEGNDPYDMEDFAMLLQESISHPVAGDIVHNGATFQVH